MARDAYWRRARCVRVVDGDTVVLDVDLGYYATVRHMMRLLGLDTPEVRSRDAAERARAREATLFTSAWTAVHQVEAKDGDWTLHVRTEKADSFGRWLARVECAGCGACLNDDLLASGLAVPFMAPPAPRGGADG